MVLCLEDLFVERIYFDETTFSNVISKVDKFYFEYFLPAIVNSIVFQSISIGVVVYFQQ